MQKETQDNKPKVWRYSKWRRKLIEVTNTAKIKKALEAADKESFCDFDGYFALY